MGDKLLQKQPPKNFLTKKPDERAPYESNYLENDHEAIVDRKTWDTVQEIMRQKKAVTAAVGRIGGRPHFLFGKLFCGECGEPMTRRTLNGPKGIKHTELLAQKQKLLGQAVQDTKTRLDALKKASEHAAKTKDNYDSWKAKYDPIKQKITETEAKLKDLKEQAKTADEQLAKGEISQEKYDALQREMSISSFMTVMTH